MEFDNNAMLIVVTVVAVVGALAALVIGNRGNAARAAFTTALNTLLNNHPRVSHVSIDEYGAQVTQAPRGMLPTELPGGVTQYEQDGCGGVRWNTHAAQQQPNPNFIPAAPHAPIPPAPAPIQPVVIQPHVINPFVPPTNPPFVAVGVPANVWVPGYGAYPGTHAAAAAAAPNAQVPHHTPGPQPGPGAPAPAASHAGGPAGIVI